MKLVNFVDILKAEGSASELNWSMSFILLFLEAVVDEIGRGEIIGNISRFAFGGKTCGGSCQR